MSLWVPFQVGFDIHGDMQDIAANKAFFDFAEVWKPKHRICGGDLWDFRCLRGKASEDERRESLAVDYQKGVEWLTKFQPQTFLRGNHCERLWLLAEKGVGIAADYAVKATQDVDKVLKKLKCTMLPYHNRLGVYDLGSLRVMHGFGSGIYTVRRMTQAYGSLIMGHLHTVDIVTVEGDHRRVGRICGALCRLDMEYAVRQVASLRWAHGWAYGVVNERTGSYQVWVAENIDGKWILPTGVREI